MYVIAPSQAAFLVGKEEMPKLYAGETILVEPEGCKLTYDIGSGHFFLLGYERGGADVATVIARIMEAKVHA